MKRNDIKTLADKTVAELNKQLQASLLELAKKRHEKKVGRLANPRSVSILSDDIARIKTVLRHQELMTGVVAAEEVETKPKKQSKKVKSPKAE